MATSSTDAFEAALRRMYHRHGVDSLPSHLENVCGVAEARLRQLDVGVFGVDHADRGRPLIARLFSASGPFAAAERDLAVLRYLAEIDFPAERPVGDDPLSSHEGQAVLVTGLVKEAPKPQRPPKPSWPWAA
jgi:hypothetical protein